MNNFSCANLLAMGRHIPLPFQISVNKDMGQVDLCIDSILRIVPGKRLIGISTWDGKAVIVKLFFQSGHWQRNLAADVRGINLLSQANISTPEILQQTTTVDKKGGALIIEYLEEGISLTTLLDAAHSEADQLNVLQMAIEGIATCHEAGIWQNDIHLDNFMACNDRVYLLDGGNVKSVPGSVTPATRLANLSLFFAQFPVAMDHRIETLMKHYTKQGADLPISGVSAFQEHVHIARRRRIASYEKKLFRSTTANRCVRSASQTLVYDREIESAEFEAFVADPDLAIENGKLIKDGNTATVAEVTIADRVYVLKRYNIKSFTHGLRSLFGKSRAYNSWRYASVLEMLGVGVPHPYVFMEERVLWFFRRRAYFLCELIDAEHLLASFEAQPEQSKHFDDVLAAFSLLLETMRDYNISHGGKSVV